MRRELRGQRKKGEKERTENLLVFSFSYFQGNHPAFLHISFLSLVNQ